MLCILNFRKFTRLNRELKDKNWDIVEHSRNRVDAFRRTLPLLSDLKNPAMRERHWDRVRKAMNKYISYLFKSENIF